MSAGDTVIEASSGSTSIAMALACAQLGLRFIAVMPEGVSNERVLMIRGYGGEVRFTPPRMGSSGRYGKRIGWRNGLALSSPGNSPTLTMQKRTNSGQPVKSSTRSPAGPWTEWSVGLERAGRW